MKLLGMRLKKMCLSVLIIISVVGGICAAHYYHNLYSNFDDLISARYYDWYSGNEYSFIMDDQLFESVDVEASGLLTVGHVEAPPIIVWIVWDSIQSNEQAMNKKQGTIWKEYPTSHNQDETVLRYHLIELDQDSSEYALIPVWKPSLQVGDLERPLAFYISNREMGLSTEGNRDT